MERITTKILSQTVMILNLNKNSLAKKIKNLIGNLEIEVLIKMRIRVMKAMTRLTEVVSQKSNKKSSILTILPTIWI